jgi:hypothetical protein
MDSTEKYRHECEVRYVVKKEPAEIRSYLELVERRRGKPAMEKLRADARQAWKVK